MAESIESIIDRTIREAVRQAVAELRPQVGPTTSDATMQAPTPLPSIYVPVKEAARMMSAHPTTVRKLIAEGKLGRYSVEGQLRVKITDLHAYMAREGQPSPTISLDERARALLERSARRSR